MVTLPLAVSVQPNPKSRVRFMYSPYIETILSLQVLYDPHHHGALLPWVIRFKEKISPETYREIRYFGDNVREWLFLLDLVLDHPDLGRLSFAEVVEHIAAMEPSDFVFRLLSEQVPLEEVRAALADPTRSTGPILDRLGLTDSRRRDEMTRLFTSPAAVQRDLCGFLVSYWNQYFEEEYQWIELLLVKGVKDEAERLGEESLPRFLSRLSGGLVFRDKKLRRTAPEHVMIETASGPVEINLADLREIVLFPSLFVSPQNVFELEKDRLVLSYSVPPGVYLRQDRLVPPEQLSRLLKTLADETRLKIMKLMMLERQCTQGLAVELKLAEPTISRHLKLLREADLISSSKEGNYIYYSLRLERIAELHMKILDFLRN